MSSEEDTVWFDAELHAVLLLQKALRVLCQSAYSDREFPEDMFRDRKILDAGCMSISATEGVVLSSKSSFPPYVFTFLWMPISSFRTFQCRENRMLRLNLRFLEQEITDCASVNFTGETTNYNALICSFMTVNENGEVLGTYESVISLISSNPNQMERYVSAFTSQLIVEIQSEIFKNVIDIVSMFGFTVHATVTNTQITFRVVNLEHVLREKDETYRTVLSAGQYPYSLKFALHQKSAFLNAARLSNIVRLHLLADSRTVLDVPVEGLDDGIIIHSSTLPVTEFEGQVDLSFLEYQFPMSIGLSSDLFVHVIHEMGLYGSTIRATVSENNVVFRVVNHELHFQKEPGKCEIESDANEYPFVLKFDLQHKSALLNAAVLSEMVWILKTTKSLTVLDCPIGRLGNLLFYFQ